MACNGWHMPPKRTQGINIINGDLSKGSLGLWNLHMTLHQFLSMNAWAGVLEAILGTNTNSIPICTNKVSVLNFPCLKKLKFPTWEKQMKLPSCPGAAPVATRGLWTWARRRSPAARELMVWESDQPPPLRHLLLHPRIQPQHISALCKKGWLVTC